MVRSSLHSDSSQNDQPKPNPKRVSANAWVGTSQAVSNIVTSIYFMLKFFVKLLTVFYGLFGGTYVDFSTGRILAKKYEFPFIKSVVESKFEEIIEVRVDQNIIDQLLGTGSITIEYMVTSSLDSQIKEVNFKYFSNPSSKKRALLNTLKDLN